MKLTLACVQTLSSKVCWYYVWGLWACLMRFRPFDIEFESHFISIIIIIHWVQYFSDCWKCLKIETSKIECKSFFIIFYNSIPWHIYFSDCRQILRIRPSEIEFESQFCSISHYLLSNGDHWKFWKL